MKRNILRSRDGFTIVELGITLGLVAILTTIGVVSFLTVLRRNRISTLTREFVASANLARSEAIRRGSRITLCPSSNGASCVAGGSWDLGWIAFVDLNNDATVDVTVPVTEEVLHVHPGPPSDISMTGTGTIVSRITYNTRGQPEQTGDVVLANTARTVTIRLSSTGRLVTL